MNGKNHGTFHCRLQGTRTTLWNCIPELWGAKVYEIDAEKIHVFDVPCKCCPPHSKVKIWGVDTGKALTGGGKDAGEEGRKMSNVPYLGFVSVQRA